MPRITFVASVIWPLPLRAMDLLNLHNCSKCNVSTSSWTYLAVALAVAAARIIVMPSINVVRQNASSHLLRMCLHSSLILLATAKHLPHVPDYQSFANSRLVGQTWASKLTSDLPLRCGPAELTMSTNSIEVRHTDRPITARFFSSS